MEVEPIEKHINNSDLVKISMVQALITIDENTNRVMNLVKHKFCLKDKSEVVKFLVEEYIENQDEPELRPEFVAKLKKLKKEKRIRFESLAKRYGMEK
jgi:hypothetical protein